MATSWTIDQPDKSIDSCSSVLNQYIKPNCSPMATSLGELLQNERHEWPLGQYRYFIPNSVLDNLLTIPAIQTELRISYPHLEVSEISTFAETIFDSAKKLYAILLCIQKGNSICEFLKEGINDSDLPFIRTVRPSQIANNWKLCTRQHVNCLQHDHRHCGLKSVKEWSRLSIETLSRDQWMVQAPRFEKVHGKIHHQELDDNAILPFIEDHEADTDAMSGGYSDVWGVRVHEAHQDVYQSTDPNVKTPLLAIKRPFSRDIKDFKKETNMLSTLAVRNHPHLIKLLATYKYRNQYHLIFPFANANLRDYWEETGTPYRNRPTYLWFIRQVCGLASGLNAIHNFEAEIPLGDELANQGLKVVANRKYLTVADNEAKYGRHGDIKPENMLWFNELPDAGKEGIIQISDMGLGRFHKLESRSRQNPKTISGSPSYAPPEIELDKPVSRAYDVWSLACVYLEFITFMILGDPEKAGFSNARLETQPGDLSDDLFYTKVTPDGGSKYAVVRKGVVQWCEELRRHQNCSPMLEDLLNIVQNRMLVIDSSNRIRCHDLESSLTKIMADAEANETYLMGSNGPFDAAELGVKIPKGPKTRYAPLPNSDTDQDGDSAMTGRDNFIAPSWDTPNIPAIVEPRTSSENLDRYRLAQTSMPPRKQQTA